MVVVSCAEAQETQYGGPGSLQHVDAPTVIDATCPADKHVAPDGGACAVTWTKDIFPKMQTAWNCTTAACHGGKYKPDIPSDAAGAFSALEKYPGLGKPYFNPCSTDPKESGFACNTGADTTSPTCGKVMPQGGGIPAADRDSVLTWIRCGSPNN